MKRELELNRSKILEYQKNRDPYLMIDHANKVVPGELSEGYKDLNENEWFFKVHWENDPNMPAMLQLEAMSQTASICLFSLKTPPKKLYLVSIENATFRKKIKPKMKIEITSIFLERTQNIYKFKSVIREKDNRTLLSKSFLKLLWPEN